MQKLAPPTPNFLPSFKNPTKDLEHRQNAQSGWRNHPFYGSTSSHRRRYQTPKVSLNQSRKRRSHSGISMAHRIRASNPLEGRHPRQNLPTRNYILHKPKGSTSIECDHRRRMGDRKRRSGFGAIRGNPERPRPSPGTLQRRLGGEFGDGVRKSDSPKDHCGIRISPVGHRQTEASVRRNGSGRIPKISKGIQRSNVASIPASKNIGPRN